MDGTHNQEEEPVTTPFGPRPQPCRRFLALILAGLAAAATTRARADVALATASMIEEETASLGMTGLALGIDPTNPTLNFTSNVAADGSGFTYSTAGPQPYNGQLLSYSETATIAAGNETFNGMGTLFGRGPSFTTDGTGIFATTPSTSTLTLDEDLYVNDVKQYDVHLVVTLSPRGFFMIGTSSDTGYFTDLDGNKIPKSDVTSAGMYDPMTGNYSLMVTPVFPAPQQALPIPAIGIGGTSPPAGGAGLFAAQISAVPEPSSLVLTGVAAVTGLAYSGLRRARSGN
jgi:hypothetical protein